MNASGVIKQKPDKKTVKRQEKLNTEGGFINNHYIIFILILSLVINIIIESAARLSFVECIRYIGIHPVYFFYNTCLILCTLSIALLIKKRIFSLVLILILWLGAGITNSILIYYRNAPFIAADFSVLKSAFGILHIYMSGIQMILTLTAFLAVTVLLVLLLIKESKKRINYKVISTVIIVTVLVSVLPSGYIKAEKNKNTDTNITDESYEYGFACCFLNSIFSHGIDRPDYYCKKQIDSILREIRLDKEPELKPNIIALQLESFVDPYKFKNVEYSCDPIPTFRYLKQTCMSGALDVAVYGGGTANTEFEALTGMSVKKFGIGEYPYETVLSERAVESVCFNLKKYGYTSHAMHDHIATFYDRHEVYKNLGFDTFTPIEYMSGVEYNSLGWAKSSIFTDYIFDAMKSTKDRDFIFAVTAQEHGKYPTDYTDPEITVTVPEELNERKSEIEYYIDEVHNEDEWIAQLIWELKSYPEPVMVVMYGDHMPAIKLSEGQMNDAQAYQTEYVIWTNYKQKPSHPNLAAFNLLPYALDSVGIHNGVFNRMNQYGLEQNEVYIDELAALQYDVINGKMYAYNENRNYFKPSDMKFGVREIEIEKLERGKRYSVIRGKGFTEASVILINGKNIRTEFVNENELRIRSEDYKQNDIMKVAQVSEGKTVLGVYGNYIIRF